MTANEASRSERSIKRIVETHNSSIISGDQNTVSVQIQQASLPKPETVNIQAELKALQSLLTELNDPITAGVAQKLAEEAEKPKPDKSVVANTLETGLTYAKSLSGFAEAMDKLRPRVEAVAGWLGKHGYKLLPLVGLAL